jgi:hypothetical protein
MPQTSVANKMTVGIVGQIATLHGMADAQVDTAFNEEAAAALVVGRFCKQGTEDDGALAVAAVADVLKGIVVQNHEFERSVELNDDGDILPDTHFGCLKVGPVTVAPTTAVTPLSTVRVQAVAEAGHEVGDIRATASAGKTINISSLARWLTSANANEPAVLYIDMTNIALAVAD